MLGVFELAQVTGVSSTVGLMAMQLQVGKDLTAVLGEPTHGNIPLALKTDHA